MDITRVTEVTNEVVDTAKDMFEYHPWDDQQNLHGALIRKALQDAFLVILVNAPPCPDRSAALRKLREARMDCNSAITHSGKY
jgi:hypothetical protein